MKEQKALELDAEQMKALKDSIIYWRDVCSGRVGVQGTSTCPCCQMERGCSQCPIAMTTGIVECRRTPYPDFIDVATRRDIENGRWADTPAARELALAELEFLQGILRNSVLKEGEKGAATVGDYWTWKDANGTMHVFKIVQIDDCNGGVRKLYSGDPFTYQCNEREHFAIYSRPATGIEIRDHLAAKQIEKDEVERKAEKKRRLAEGWGVGIEEDKWVMHKGHDDVPRLRQTVSPANSHWRQYACFAEGDKWTKDCCRLATPEEMFKKGAKVRWESTTMPDSVIEGRLDSGIESIRNRLDDKLYPMVHFEHCHKQCWHGVKSCTLITPA